MGFIHLDDSFSWMPQELTEEEKLVNAEVLEQVGAKVDWVMLEYLRPLARRMVREQVGQIECG